MDDNLPTAPADRLEALAESDADLAAGRIVPGAVVLRDLKDSLARLEAKAAGRPRAKGHAPPLVGLTARQRHPACLTAAL